jgi:hypothetical protein
MTDPTSSTRKAIAENLLPSNSPLGKSLAEKYAKEEEQIAVDEANNLVMQKDPAILPLEAEAFTQASLPVNRMPADVSQGFVNPASVQSSTSQQSVMPSLSGGDPLATYTQGANLEAQTIGKQGQQEAQAYQNLQNQLGRINQEMQDIQAQKQKVFEQFEKEDLETRDKIKNFEIKPKNIFAGKNTWQKILGGIGMFLGSITPEGAKNVQNIIDREIDLDLDRQKNELALLKDSRSEAANRYKMKLERLGSDKLAKLSMKKDALEMVKLQVDQIAASSKGDLARSAALKGKASIEQAQQQLQATLIKEYMKQNKDSQKGMIPGYSGANQNPTIVKDLTDRMTAQRSANTSIDKLEKLLEKGSLVGTNREIAIQEREKLAADLAKAMFGRSSDTELEVARNLIPDVTSLTQRGSVDKALLKNLKQKLAQDMDAAASAAGFTKANPYGAKKIK